LLKVNVLGVTQQTRRTRDKNGKVKGKAKGKEIGKRERTQGRKEERKRELLAQPHNTLSV
jgi:hypothetical protein